ncbi:937812af-434c-4b46-a050-150a1aa9d66f [Thermothielavioides terrestris]|nr:937812af-434c-4b46-a050-150a1aa9d66f [Thermothielavioides terrestris]
MDAQTAHSKPHGGRTQVKTPELRHSNERMNGQKESAERSPSTPGHLAPFDWDEFEARYEEALADADRNEQELLKEFEELVKFFNVWASAASVHDTERGVKRLQTRERYVKIAEQSLLQKKKHLTEVVRAFQSALALLSQS